MTGATEPRFVADEMLGKLARDLRTLGYDVDYLKGAHDDQVLARALADGRRLLTRDRQLAARAGECGLLLRSKDPAAQIGEVLLALQLAPSRSRFLSRCIECNGALVEGSRAPAPPGAGGRPTWTCASCSRVYWHGTHADDMLARLGRYMA